MTKLGIIFLLPILALMAVVFIMSLNATGWLIVAGISIGLPMLVAMAYADANRISNRAENTRALRRVVERERYSGGQAQSTYIPVPLVFSSEEKSCDTSSSYDYSSSSSGGSDSSCGGSSD